MSKGQDRIVYRREDGKWVNKRNDADKASSLHSTQKEAVGVARAMLYKQEGGELIVKGVDGKIRSKDTIFSENDPYSINVRRRIGCGMKAPDNVCLIANNFGPISKAKIDLKPLTIFIGPSNTGKSYLAILLYTIQQSFANLASQTIGYMEKKGGLLSTFLKQNIPKLDDNNAQTESAISRLCNITFRESKEFSELFEQRIKRNLGVNSVGELKQVNSSSDTNVEIQFGWQNHSKNHVKFHFDFNSKKISTTKSSFQVLQDKLLYENDRQTLTRFPSGIRKYDSFNYELDTINEMLLEIIEPLHRKACYLPAGRTGLMCSYEALVSSLILDIGSAQDKTIQTPTGITRDFLNNLFRGSINQRRKFNWRIYEKYAEYLEKNILQGEIVISEQKVLPEILFSPTNWKNRTLQLGSTSSMISELAPIVQYLRNTVSIGGTLIIEEPEAHLHPQALVKLTKLIADLISNNLRVIVTTHSELMLEQLANLILLKKVELKEDDVGVWQFKQRKRGNGTTVKQIYIDKDSGIFPANLTDESLELYNQWVDFSNDS